MKRPGSELWESLAMALLAIAAHKLRSSLTLLGVLVGVFSIILVITAMRALKNNIEHELGQLGGTTFVIQRRPGAQFAGPEGFLKIWRRPRILFDQANAFKRRASFAPVVGFQSASSNGEEVTSRFGKSPPTIPIEGATPGTWQTNNWTLLEGAPVARKRRRFRPRRLFPQQGTRGFALSAQLASRRARESRDGAARGRGCL